MTRVPRKSGVRRYRTAHVTRPWHSEAADGQMTARCDGLLFVLVLAAAAQSSRVSRSDDSAACTNPRGQYGTCVNIKKCSELINMLRQQRQKPGVADFLRASACGYDGRDPKVCCPGPDTRTTPPESSSRAPVREQVELPKDSECGTQDADVEDVRIVGGIPAELGAWPWIAALGYKSSSDVKFLCGGALITRRHVITAGHCVHSRRDLYLVRLGDLDLKRTDDGASPIEVLVEDRKVHEGYNPTTFVNDIAILRLREDVAFTSMIRPICLPLEPSVRSRDFVRHFPFLAGWGSVQFNGPSDSHLAGWGSVQFNGPSDSHLQQLQIPVVTLAHCKDAFKTFATAHIDERVMCAGYAQGGKDACQGDSGGPLMWPKSRKFYLIGVVSYGFKCAEPGYPGVYTKVTAFLDWITENLI